MIVAPFALSLVRGSRKKRLPNGLSNNRRDLTHGSTRRLLKGNNVLGKAPQRSAEIEPSTLDLSLLAEELLGSADRTGNNKSFIKDR